MVCFVRMDTAKSLINPRASSPLWFNVSFMLMWTSVAASGFGDRIVQLAAYEMGGISTAGAEPAKVTAAVTFFFTLPYVLFGVVGGWIADTLPRKWVMLFCDEARAAILLLAFVIAPAGVVAALGPEHIWKVYAIVFATGMLAAIFSPTKAAIMPQIVPMRQLQSANAIVLGIAVIASMIGFKVGDAIIESESVRGGLKYAFLSFFVSGLFFAFLKVRKSASHAIGAKSGQIKRLIQATGYIRRHRPIMLLIVQSIAFWATAHLFLNALGVLCLRNYGFAEVDLRSGIAEMSLVVGIGMLSSAGWVAWMAVRRESTWMALGGLMATGVCMFIMALNRSYTLGLVFGFAAGFCGNTAMIVVSTLTQSITPNYIRGRVFGVRDIVVTFTGVLVNLAIWQLPGSNDWMVPALLVVAIVLTIGSAAGLIFELRRGPMPSVLINILCRGTRVYALIWHRLRWVGRANIPADGPVILASNHTTGIDPILMQVSCRRMILWVMLTSYRFKLAQPLWRRIEPICLDREVTDTTQLRQIIRALQEDAIVGLFPEGGLQRQHRELGPFQTGLAMIAKRSGATIVPVWIAGTPRRKNILWHFLQPSKSTVIFGKPFTPNPSDTYEQTMEDLRRRMLELAKQESV
jgi:1-acyl-sn-glycerol-3-phosphate acyltransferase